MPLNPSSTIKVYHIRARVPQVVRYTALALAIAAVITVVVGFYRERTKTPFRLKGEHAKLSTDVVGEVHGYERIEAEDGVRKYYVKAEFARTFADDHKELRNAYFEVYGRDGSVTNKMSAEDALYVPEADRNFTAYLKGKVQLETNDQLRIKTPQVTYTKASDLAEGEEIVEFERGNIRGRSTGARVQIQAKRVELLSNVQIETFESPETLKANVRYSKIDSGSALFDHGAGRIELNQSVSIHIVSTPGANGSTETDARALRAVVKLTGGETSQIRPTTFELMGNVWIQSTEQGKTATTIESGYAMYDKTQDRFDLREGSRIVTGGDAEQADIRSHEAVYDRANHKLALYTNVVIVQGTDTLRADKVFADLVQNNRLKNAVLRGNASARQQTEERTVFVTAPELNAEFGDDRKLIAANASGTAVFELIPAKAGEYSKITATAARGVGLTFRSGLLQNLVTDGRTSIDMTTPGGFPNAANKRLTADQVNTDFFPNGRDMRRAEAVGNAEILVDPVVSDEKSYRTVSTAARFDCDFFDTGNDVKNCVGRQKTRTVRTPKASSIQRGEQILTADQISATFTRGGADVQAMLAEGGAKFTERDRNAIAKEVAFSAADGILRLRGGEPTIWDSQGRAKAGEIDWDTRNQRAALRGSVSTTYYNAKQLNDSSPFSSTEKPIFLTAGAAEFDHKLETASYSGNARAWQENNFIKGDRILIDRRAGTFRADGNTQSALYQARATRNGKESAVPTFASARSVTYIRDQRLIQYRSDVDIRQGSDRITSGSADIYLTEKNELLKTVAEKDVILSQPNRKATGNWAQYTASDEVAILRGEPATITDTENGSSQSSQVTFSLRERRVLTENKARASGRSRTVYKIKVP